MKLLSLVLFLFSLPVLAQNKLHYYDYTAGWQGSGLGGEYTETFIFNKSDPYKFIFKGHVDTPDMGAVYSYGNAIYTDQNGKKRLVPNYLLTIYSNLKKLKSHWDTYGGSLYRVSNSNRLEVTIEYMDEADHDNEYKWKGGEAGEAYWSKVFRGLYFTLDAGLDPKKLISTLAHEYFHLVQYSLYTTYRNKAPGVTRLVVIESGAEWASDVNLSIVTKYLPANHGLPNSLDKLNGYRNRIEPWFTELMRDFDQYDANGTVQYEATVFFKYLMEWSTNDSPGKDVREFMRFNDIYYSYWNTGKSGFINAVQDFLGGKEKLKAFLKDFVSAHINQLDGSKLSFRDDAFNLDPSGNPKTTMFLLKEDANNLAKSSRRCHYSLKFDDVDCKGVPALQSTVAKNDEEIQQRLQAIALELKMSDFGLNFFSVKTPHGPNVLVGNQLQEKNTMELPSNLFLYTETPSEETSQYPLVLYTQATGQLLKRTNTEGLKRINDFVSKKQSTGAWAYKKFIGNFCDDVVSTECHAGSIKAAWIGGMKFVEGATKNYRVGFVVTPTIQKAKKNYTPAPNGPFDTDSIWLTKSVPERKATEKFKKGDKITFKLNFSDRIHSAEKQNFSADEVTAEIKLIQKSTGDKVDLEKGKIKWRLIDKATWSYEVDIVLPKVKKKGMYKVEFLVRSLLKLGEDDKFVDDSLEINLKGKVGLDDRSDN